MTSGNVYVVLASTFPMVFVSEDDANAYAEASGNEGVHVCALRDHDDTVELLDGYAGDDEEDADD